jgi:excisionase family DNA binding protein
VTLQGLTVKQVSERLNLRRHAVLALINSGALRASDVSLKPGGRATWRILESDVEDFLETREFHPEPPRRKRRKPATVRQYF